MQYSVPLPDMMAIDGRNGVLQLADHFALAPDAGVDDVHDPYLQPTYDEGNGNADDSTDKFYCRRSRALKDYRYDTSNTA